MPHIPCFPPRLRPLLAPAGWMLLTFFLTAAQLSHAYAPVALAAVTLAGPGFQGLSALLGAAGGAFFFFQFQPGLRFLASALLLFAANTALYDTQLFSRPWFPTAVSITLTCLVQSVWLFDQSAALGMVFVISLLLQGAACQLLRPLQETASAVTTPARLLLTLCAAAALLDVTVGGFSCGRCCLVLILLFFARSGASPATCAALGMAVGLAADLANMQPAFLLTAAYAGGCALAALSPQRPLFAGLLFCAGFGGIVLLFGTGTPVLFLVEALLGAFFSLWIPRQLPGRLQNPSPTEGMIPSPGHPQLERSAAAFRDLYDSFFRGTTPTPPENPSVIFDRTAQQVCRKCVLRQTCWQQNYNTTYNAFNDAYPALLRRGQAQAQDFPQHFTSRCVHLQEFLAVLNGELHSFLQRRQYHRRLLDLRRQAQEQYAQLGDLLSATAAVETMTTPPIGYRIGSALRPREGCQVCGDQLAVFEVGGTLYLLLSDGMGSGEDAHREAAMTVRLLRQFLEAGIDPSPALRTLNSAMALRSEDGGGFTTIDLLALQRSSGSAVLYKYGAAPSYLKHSGSVSRFTAASLPAGLHSNTLEPGCSRFSLPGGSYFVMVSDGIADQSDDEWLQNLLAGWDGGDAAALTTLILTESRSRKGLGDDCAVLVVHLAPPDDGGKIRTILS